MALVLRPKRLFYTPTGNELPPLQMHLRKVADKIGAEIIIPKGPSLASLIYEFQAVPNFRMRWCTRAIKIQPAMAYIHTHPDVRLAVGLRADEPQREGMYGIPDDRYCFPLRERNMGLDDVLQVCREEQCEPPVRTDCAVCFYQRIGEWFALWRDWPKHWAQGVAWERWTGHTLRSEERDTWPAAMEGLQREFERGRRPRPRDMEIRPRCRLCSM